jgi:hypothetical protein
MSEKRLRRYYVLSSSLSCLAGRDVGGMTVVLGTLSIIRSDQKPIKDLVQFESLILAQNERWRQA